VIFLLSIGGFSKEKKRKEKREGKGRKEKKRIIDPIETGLTNFL